MQQPRPKAFLPISLAAGVFLLGSTLIIISGGIQDTARRSARSSNEEVVTKKAEECIKDPSKSGGELLDHKLLSIDVSSRLKSALLNHNHAVNGDISPASKHASDQVSGTDFYRACKKYVGDIMGRDVASMSSDYSDGSAGIAGISYIRSDDGKLFKYECKTDGQTIVWRGIDVFGPGQGPGRWRDEDSRPVASYL